MVNAMDPPPKFSTEYEQAVYKMYMDFIESFLEILERAKGEDKKRAFLDKISKKYGSNQNNTKDPIKLLILNLLMANPTLNEEELDKLKKDVKDYLLVVITMKYNGMVLANFSEEEHVRYLVLRQLQALKGAFPEKGLENLKEAIDLAQNSYFNDGARTVSMQAGKKFQPYIQKLIFFSENVTLPMIIEKGGPIKALKKWHKNYMEKKEEDEREEDERRLREEEEEQKERGRQKEKEARKLIKEVIKKKEGGSSSEDEDGDSEDSVSASEEDESDEDSDEEENTDRYMWEMTVTNVNEDNYTNLYSLKMQLQEKMIANGGRDLDDLKTKLSQQEISEIIGTFKGDRNWMVDYLRNAWVYDYDEDREKFFKDKIFKEDQIAGMETSLTKDEERALERQTYTREPPQYSTLSTNGKRADMLYIMQFFEIMGEEWARQIKASTRADWVDLFVKAVMTLQHNVDEDPEQLSKNEFKFIQESIFYAEDLEDNLEEVELGDDYEDDDSSDDESNDEGQYFKLYQQWENYCAQRTTADSCNTEQACKWEEGACTIDKGEKSGRHFWYEGTSEILYRKLFAQLFKKKTKKDPEEKTTQDGETFTRWLWFDYLEDRAQKDGCAKNISKYYDDEEDEEDGKYWDASELQNLTRLLGSSFEFRKDFDKAGELVKCYWKNKLKEEFVKIEPVEAPKERFCDYSKYARDLYTWLFGCPDFKSKGKEGGQNTRNRYNELKKKVEDEIRAAFELRNVKIEEAFTKAYNEVFEEFKGQSTTSDDDIRKLDQAYRAVLRSAKFKTGVEKTEGASTANVTDDLVLDSDMRNATEDQDVLEEDNDQFKSTYGKFAGTDGEGSICKSKLLRGLLIESDSALVKTLISNWEMNRYMGYARFSYYKLTAEGEAEQDIYTAGFLGYNDDMGVDFTAVYDAIALLVNNPDICSEDNITTSRSSSSKKSADESLPEQLERTMDVDYESESAEEESDDENEIMEVRDEGVLPQELDDEASTSTYGSMCSEWKAILEERDEENLSARDERKREEYWKQFNECTLPEFQTVLMGEYKTRKKRGIKKSLQELTLDDLRDAAQNNEVFKGGGEREKRWKALFEELGVPEEEQEEMLAEESRWEESLKQIEEEVDEEERKRKRSRDDDESAGSLKKTKKAALVGAWLKRFSVGCSQCQAGGQNASDSSSEDEDEAERQGCSAGSIGAEAATTVGSIVDLIKLNKI